MRRQFLGKAVNGALQFNHGQCSIFGLQPLFYFVINIISCQHPLIRGLRRIVDTLRPLLRLPLFPDAHYRGDEEVEIALQSAVQLIEQRHVSGIVIPATYPTHLRTFT